MEIFLLPALDNDDAMPTVSVTAVGTPAGYITVASTDFAAIGAVTVTVADTDAANAISTPAGSITDASTDFMAIGAVTVTNADADTDADADADATATAEADDVSPADM